MKNPKVPLGTKKEVTDRTIEDLTKVPLDKDGDPEKYFLLGTALTPEQKKELVTLLREYPNIFA